MDDSIIYPNMGETNSKALDLDDCISTLHIVCYPQGCGYHNQVVWIMKGGTFRSPGELEHLGGFVYLLVMFRLH